MKKKNRGVQIATKTAAELAVTLGLSKEDGVEIELRSELNSKIIEVVRRKRLTHAAVARKASTSRTRVTALLNRNTHNISTGLMIRILAALGYETKVRFTKLAA